MNGNGTWDLDFKKASSSQYGDGNRTHCVEVKRSEREVLVRDSKSPQGKVLSFTHDEWRAFTKGIRLGEFDV